MAACIPSLVLTLQGTGHDSWIRPALYVTLVGAALFAKPTRSETKRWARIVKEHSLIKPWLATCALASAVVAVLATFFSIRLLDGIRFAGLFGLLLLLLAPLLVIAEYQKFKEAGSSNDDAT